MGTSKLLTTVAAIALFGAAGHAQAQEKLKVGVIATLSGPPAVLGQQLRNGFQLAVKNLGGKLGGREVELVVEDDELKPDMAVNKAKGLDRSNQGGLCRRPDLFQHLHSDHEAGH